MLTLAAATTACGGTYNPTLGGNGAPSVTVISAPATARVNRAVEVDFRVSDPDGDWVTVRLSTQNAGRGWFVTTNEPYLPPGAVSRAWFHAVDPGLVTLVITVSDGREEAVVATSLRVTE